MAKKKISKPMRLYKIGKWFITFEIFFLVGAISAIILLTTNKINNGNYGHIYPTSILFFVMTFVFMIGLMIWGGFGYKYSIKINDLKMKNKFIFTFIPLLNIVWLYFCVAAMIALKEANDKPIQAYIQADN
ncbi:hypothetical protein [Metamycoplasma neophronis]|uniref:DUF805 domain-containing protein n=1 Tax=Metamycoplasma neophronis TaxID=872983 RepID=A0ABY2Z156_9BACT|nr:hypothetical protein [Metamycoplasma neophronis]TPR54282.1 hypothetical protein FJR74_00680 [Metamycoplasma neophronis]